MFQPFEYYYENQFLKNSITTIQYFQKKKKFKKAIKKKLGKIHLTLKSQVVPY